MDSIEFIKLEFVNLRRQIDSVLIDLNEDQFNWNPPGTANAIRTSLLHLIATEDYYVQKIILGNLRIWELQGWSQKTGLSAPPSASRGWEEIQNANLAFEPVLAYAQSVSDAISEYVNNLVPEDLDRQVELYGRQRPIAEVLIRLFMHSAVHVGEIAAVRGFQGVKGLPV